MPDKIYEIGDKVKILMSTSDMEDDNSYGGRCTASDVVTITSKKRSNSCGRQFIYLVNHESEFSSWMESNFFELVQAKLVPRLHADLIKQWADDSTLIIQVKVDDSWMDCRLPSWFSDKEYRIKPEEIPIKIKSLDLKMTTEEAVETIHRIKKAFNL